MQQYLDLMTRVMNEGTLKSDRTEQELKVYLVIKCDLIYQRDSLYNNQNFTCVPLFTNCYGS